MSTPKRRPAEMDQLRINCPPLLFYMYGRGAIPFGRAAMRVIAGKYRSRPLQSLGGMDIRPTSDRLRETLFNVLTAGNPAALTGSVWIDLFAGTGAVGIEALSRGAGAVCFVENSPEAADVIRKNLQSLGISSGFKILQEDVSGAIKHFQAQGMAANFVFLDPPYRMKDVYTKTLHGLAECAAVSAATLIIAEHEKQFDPGDKFGELRRYRILPQGSAALSFYRRWVEPIANQAT
jgi:16S rRNA (guanine966-N2)-methyltransferase